MNIYTVLKQEHEAVKDLLMKACDTTERAEKSREELYQELLRELHSHAEAEQNTLYARLDEEEGMEWKRLLAEAKEEHVRAEQLLQELGEMDKTTIEWTAKIAVLQSQIEHHVEEEEEEMFKKAKEILKEGEAERLAEAFLAQKKEILSRLS